ncbi:hypothetical protein [Plantactinospora soyae]|uniref:Uncharacterized protein n=1 Tax=Plantactinospora soyae TaxID=1544732 RepID=A0A927MAT9_9ACTN|nr:hypothetical protein [Plantactinospora soyae]MBE1487660.1 hypothetical protein [Plantactinospora soyae]
MRVGPAIDEQWVVEVAQAMLDRAAAVQPAQAAAERRVFDVLRQAYFADPKRALAGGDRGGGQLKFGLPGVEELLTPVLLNASAGVLAHLASLGVLNVAVASTRGVRRLLGLEPGAPRVDRAAPTRTVADAPVEDSTPALTADQWIEVRSIVTRALVRHGRMSPQRAELLAAAIIGDGFTERRPE